MARCFNFGVVDYKGLRLFAVYNMPPELVGALDFKASNGVLVASRGGWDFRTRELFLQGAQNDTDTRSKVIRIDKDRDISLWLDALKECKEYVLSQTTPPPYIKR